MDYLSLPDNAARQLIDSITVFDEYRRVEALARRVAGGMYWKRQEGHEYLVKTSPDNRQQRLGARSAETERTYAAFTKQKTEIETRLKSIKTARIEAERMNKALKVGRTPATAIAVLQALEDAGLGEHFVVVGTHALYAYETAAGVRIVQSALATQDVDLLWDARRRVQFLSDLIKLDTSVLKVLQRADPSFIRQDDKLEAAINDKGFEVEFLRQMNDEGDEGNQGAFRFSADEGDIYPVQARRAAVLTSAARFTHVVVSATGRMALMRTVAPETFVSFKRWMAQDAPGREEAKRRRDTHQAAIVEELLDKGLLLAQAGSPPAHPASTQ
jgi:hypothetical protein